jgi:DNA-binding LacI/PurR family transcriptional regulator
MATLHDVARIAKVNISTVSRYLSGELKVTPETEARISMALTQTGYKPNLIARSLRKGLSNLIGVAAPDIYQPGIAGIVYGIDQYLSSTSCFLSLLMYKSQAEREIYALQQFRNMMVGGVIVIGHPLDYRNTDAELVKILGKDTPIVLISRNFSKSELVEICPDQVAGAKLITGHLLERGYKKIGLIVSHKSHPDARQKLVGYEQTLGEWGIPKNKDLIQEGYYDAATTAKAADRLIDERVDAIFCTSDEMAIYTIERLGSRGLSVPNQVAVAGYGGSKWLQMISPKLTTVIVQVEELGRKAAEALIEGKENNICDGDLVRLPVQLRIGDTT